MLVPFGDFGQQSRLVIRDASALDEISRRHNEQTTHVNPRSDGEAGDKYKDRRANVVRIRGRGIDESPSPKVSAASTMEMNCSSAALLESSTAISCNTLSAMLLMFWLAEMRSR